MTEPTKEEQLRAALLAIRALLFPDVRQIVQGGDKRRELADALNAALIKAITAVLAEITDAELSGN